MSGRPPPRRPRRPHHPGPPPAPELELDLDRLAAGGDAVGRDPDGRVTFVPRGAPGDRVRARVIEEHKSFARATLAAVLAPSPARVAPRCPLFVAEACGGCAWQHVADDAQAAAKHAIVAGALRRQLERGLVVHPIGRPVAPYGWRRRARLHWLRHPKLPAATIGFFAPDSRKLTQVDACPQLEPGLEAVLGPLREVLAPGLEGRGEVELLVGERGDVHVAIRGRCAEAAARALVGRAGIVGVAVEGGVELGAAAVALEADLEGRADRFAQASRAGNAALVAAVMAASGAVGGRRVLELHAGSGNFTRALAAAGATVDAVERVPGPSAADPRVTWHVGAAERVVEAMARRGEAVDLALLDPPRTGAREVMAPLARLGAPAIVYVSCDPATLGRDVEELVAGGYRAAECWPLDLMPQTAHLEVVVRLERVG